MVEAKQDSIYQNFGTLEPGVVVADEKGHYLSLIKPTNVGWTVTNLNNKTVASMQELENWLADINQLFPCLVMV